MTMLAQEASAQLESRTRVQLKHGLAAVYVRDLATHRRRATLAAHNGQAMPAEVQSAYLTWLASRPPQQGCGCPTCDRGNTA